MPGAGGLSSVADGSARFFDFWRRLDNFTIANNAFWARGGNSVSGVSDVSSNLGFGAHLEEVSFLNRVHCIRMRQGCKGSTVAGCPINLDATVIRSFPVGVWVYETLLNMQAANAAGQENGIWFGIATGSRPYNAAAGFGVNRSGATAVFYTRGPLGLQEFVLPGITPNEWNLYRFEFRHRTALQASSLRLLVNGTLMESRSWETPADNLPQTVAALGQTMFYPHFGIAMAGAADWVYYRDQHWFCGPDVGLGVL